jgi:hypothetical protein
VRLAPVLAGGLLRRGNRLSPGLVTLASRALGLLRVGPASLLGLSLGAALLDRTLALDLSACLLGLLLPPLLLPSLATGQAGLGGLLAPLSLALLVIATALFLLALLSLLPLRERGRDAGGLRGARRGYGFRRGVRLRLFGRLADRRTRNVRGRLICGRARLRRLRCGALVVLLARAAEPEGSHSTNLSR